MPLLQFPFLILCLLSSFLLARDIVLGSAVCILTRPCRVALLVVFDTPDKLFFHEDELVRTILSLSLSPSRFLFLSLCLDFSLIRKLARLFSWNEQRAGSPSSFLRVCFFLYLFRPVQTLADELGVLSRVCSLRCFLSFFRGICDHHAALNRSINRVLAVAAGAGLESLGQ